MRIVRRCSCGRQLAADVPRRKRDVVLGNWYAKHSGPGHGDAAPERSDRDAARAAEALRWAPLLEYDGT